MINALQRLASRISASRDPDFVIGGRDNPYLERWFVIPRNPVFNIYLHRFLRSDDDRALHTHPWLFNLSILLEGQYVEHTSDGSSYRQAGDFKFRFGAAPHRVELVRAAFAIGGMRSRAFGKPLPCWTLFITGPRVRQWGFLCPQGWVHWKKFTASDDPGSVGRGCDQ